MKALPDANERVVDDRGRLTEQTRLYLLELATIVGSASVIINALVKTVSITSADSPYTVTTDSERVYVDATGGDVVVNLRPVALDVYCNVIRQDASANNVDVASADLIIGSVSQPLTSQYDSIECIGSANEYYIK